LRQDPFAASAAIKHLIDLGYLPATAEKDQERAAQLAAAESQFNLGVVQLETGRASLAMPIFERLVAANPQNARYVLALAKCQADLQLHAECRRTVESLEARAGRTPDGDLLLAGALFNTGDADAALRRLRDVELRYPPSPTLYHVVGSIHLSQGRWADAQRAFAQAIELDADHAHAHHGLAQALLEQQQFECAAEHALRAVALLYHFPAAHYRLGVALQEMNEPVRAIQSMEAAVAMSPGFVEARQRLAALYRAAGDIAHALHHERAAQGYAPAGQRPVQRLDP
jgi:tetratricopeptide (TPR) repeat protein